jgi:hypothetical protein
MEGSPWGAMSTSIDEQMINWLKDRQIYDENPSTVLALLIHGTLTQANQLIIHGNQKKLHGRNFFVLF